MTYLKPKITVWFFDKFFSCPEPIFRSQACLLLAFAIMIKEVKNLGQGISHLTLQR
jgi:hypothetical protein